MDARPTKETDALVAKLLDRDSEAWQDLADLELHAKRIERERDEAREALAKLAPIGARIATQDNRCTSLPVFMVEQKRRIWGMEEGDQYEWMETEEWTAADEEKAEWCEQYCDENLQEPDGFTRRYYTDIWEFCTACFTEQGCKDYLAANGHNLNESRIYVHSGYRNAEWELIRDVIKQTAREGGV